ncbi:hemerythrin domain-containing protein [Acinetobacter lwoffii]|uniref:hemerythrin domain-containing protein n=1 Tax=Acinetobacter lwoffii TaxID=28090 RepID=UPI00269A38A2
MLFNWLKQLFSSLFNGFNPSKADNPQNETALDLGNRHSIDTLSKHDDVGIPFYPNLIKHLELDHQQLLSLYSNIGNSLYLQEYHLLPDQLAQFKQDFKAHLDAENIKFYGYLEQGLKEQSQAFLSLRQFRKEMRVIERTVIKFIDHWMDFGVNRAAAAEFRAEYEAIGSALVQRIEREEKELYTMYSRV